jgi:hypothetical protein
VGITPCGVNTSAAVGTPFRLQFVLMDRSGSEALRVFTVERTVTVVSRCDQGLYLCEGSCLQVITPSVQTPLPYEVWLCLHKGVC